LVDRNFFYNNLMLLHFFCGQKFSHYGFPD
jgi:hypothetical protein